MNAKAATNDWQARVVQAWLLALLRFAVTRDNDDKLAVFAVATEIDKLGSRQVGLVGFRFFHKATAEVCDAISSPQRADSVGVLRRHLERMQDDRLKRAFAAALELDHVAAKSGIKPVKSKAGEDLWKGLRC